MALFSKITYNDKVSAWVSLLNKIVDFLVPAKAPSEGDGGCDGYMTKEDKAILESLDDTYMPLNGVSSVTSSYKNNVSVITPPVDESFNITAISDDVIIFNAADETERQINIFSADIDIFSIKYLVVTSESDVEVKINYNDALVCSVMNDSMMFRVIFIGGDVFLEKIEKYSLT